jgi:hypothetical protein
MDFLERKKSKFILGSELLRNSKKREKEDTLERVKEEVLPTQECQRKYFGSEGKES